MFGLSILNAEYVFVKFKSRSFRRFSMDNVKSDEGISAQNGPAERLRRAEGRVNFGPN